jgi:hypothetical protein
MEQIEYDYDESITTSSLPPVKEPEIIFKVRQKLWLFAHL